MPYHETLQKLQNQVTQISQAITIIRSQLGFLDQLKKDVTAYQQTKLRTESQITSAKAQIKLIQNRILTLQKGHYNLKRKIKYTQKRIKQLQRQKIETHRGARIIGTAAAGARQYGRGRQYRRIFGSLPGGGVATCTCGSSDEDTDYGATAHVRNICYDTHGTGGSQIITCTLNLAAAACVVIMAAVVTNQNEISFNIERPLATDVTDQRTRVTFGKSVTCGDVYPNLIKVEACESLAAGAYTWRLVWRHASLSANVYAAWIKARETVCTCV